MIDFNEEHLRNAQGRINALLSSLPNAGLLFLLGVVDAPVVGQTVSFLKSGKTCNGVVKSLDLTEGVAVVEYTRTAFRYKKAVGDDDSESQFWKNSTYNVPFEVEEPTTDKFEFRYLYF